LKRVHIQATKMADRPTGSSHISMTMAVLAAAGGVAGFLRTRSKPSLIAGLGIGSLFAFGTQQINVRSDLSVALGTKH